MIGRVVFRQFFTSSSSSSNFIPKNSSIFMKWMPTRNIKIFSRKNSPSKSNVFQNLLIGGGVIGVGATILAYQQNVFSFEWKPIKFLKNNKVSSKKNSDESELISQKIIDLPESVPYLIIGGGSAAFSAARTIRGNDPTARILMIADENHYPYSRTPLSKELWFSGVDLDRKLSFKQYNTRERSIYYEDEEFYLPLNDFQTAPHGGISVVKQHRVVQLDVENQKAHLNNGQIISFGKCLLATGSKPKNLRVFDKASYEIQEKVILYRSPEDFKKLYAILPHINSITIIGNSLLGSELVFSLREKSRRSNVEINHVFEEKAVLVDLLPNYLSEWCTEKIQAEGIKVISNTNVQNVKFNKHKNQLELTLSNGEELKTDICIVDNGVEPNIDFLKTSSLETDEVHGGIVVNAEMQARSNVWAAGDIACFYDQKFGRRREQCHDNAIFTGKLAGENMTKQSGQPYLHYTRFWSDFGADIGFEAIGLIDSSLSTFGVFAAETSSDDGSHNEKSSDQTKNNKFQKGLLFYMKNNSIVGIILWNVFDVNNMHIARRVLHDGFQNQDLNEVAKLFSIYETKNDLDGIFDENNQQKNETEQKGET